MVEVTTAWYAGNPTPTFVSRKSACVTVPDTVAVNDPAVVVTEYVPAV